MEKPFGSNLAIARGFNALLSSFRTEQQVFRVDHFLGDFEAWREGTVPMDEYPAGSGGPAHWPGALRD